MKTRKRAREEEHVIQSDFLKSIREPPMADPVQTHFLDPLKRSPPTLQVEKKRRPMGDYISRGWNALGDISNAFSFGYNPDGITPTTIIQAIADGDINIVGKVGASASVSIFGQFDGESVFGKVFFDHIGDTLKQTEACADSLGLAYERDVYTRVAPMLSYFSPNFLQPVVSVSVDVNDLPHDESRRVFARLVDSLNQTIPKSCKPDQDHIGIIFTQYVKHKALADILEDNPAAFTELELRKILAQVVLSLAVMSFVKLVQNDMHPGNVMIETLPVETELKYNIPSAEHGITIDTTYKAYLFDWDFAWGPKFPLGLGDNPKIDDWSCEDLGICNGYDVVFDIFTLFCSLVNMLSPLENTPQGHIYTNFMNFYSQVSGFTVDELIGFPEDIELSGGFYCRLPRRSSSPQHSKYKRRFPGEIIDDPVRTFMSIVENPYIRGVLN